MHLNFHFNFHLNSNLNSEPYTSNLHMAYTSNLHMAYTSNLHLAYTSNLHMAYTSNLHLAGSSMHLSVPLETFLSYAFFWTCTGAGPGHLGHPPVVHLLHLPCAPTCCGTHWGPYLRCHALTPSAKPRLVPRYPGAFKLAFAYYGLAKPLVEPIAALWLRSFDGDGGGRNLNNMMENEEAVAKTLLRCLCITLRTITPTLVFFFDTGAYVRSNGCTM